MTSPLSDITEQELYSAIAASILRLIYCIFLFKNADYSYVKEQTLIWTHGEISFGIICSCLFVLPRLYRHLASIPPYGSDDYDDYQRGKSLGDGGWSEHVDRKRQIKGSERIAEMGGLDSDIRKPPVPPKSWLGSKTDD